MKCAAEKDGVEEVSLNAAGCWTAHMVQARWAAEAEKVTGETQWHKMEKASDKKEQELLVPIAFFFYWDLTGNKVPHL